jgi:hypothetical protein
MPLASHLGWQPRQGRRGYAGVVSLPPSRNLTRSSSPHGRVVPRRTRRRRSSGRRRSWATRRRRSTTYNETDSPLIRVERGEKMGVWKRLPTEIIGGRRMVVGLDGPTARSVTSTVSGSPPATAAMAPVFSCSGPRYVFFPLSVSLLSPSRLGLFDGPMAGPYRPSTVRHVIVRDSALESVAQ